MYSRLLLTLNTCPLSTRDHLIGVRPLLQLCDHDYRTHGTCCGPVDCRCIPFNATWIVGATWWIHERMEGDMNVSDMKESKSMTVHGMFGGRAKYD